MAMSGGSLRSIANAFDDMDFSLSPAGDVPVPPPNPTPLSQKEIQEAEAAAIKKMEEDSQFFAMDSMGSLLDDIAALDASTAASPNNQDDVSNDNNGIGEGEQKFKLRQLVDAIYMEDAIWYQAEIIGIPEEGISGYTVRFLGYGNVQEDTPVDLLRPVEDEEQVKIFSALSALDEITLSPRDDYVKAKNNAANKSMSSMAESFQAMMFQDGSQKSSSPDDGSKPLSNSAPSLPEATFDNMEGMSNAERKALLLQEAKKLSRGRSRTLDVGTKSLAPSLSAKSKNQAAPDSSKLSGTLRNRLQSARNQRQLSKGRGKRRFSVNIRSKHK